MSAVESELGVAACAAAGFSFLGGRAATLFNYVEEGQPVADIKSPVESQSADGFGVFLRVFWMFLGSVALAVSAMAILKSEKMLSIADVVYVVIIPLMVAARYVDITRYKGTTAYGEPATMRHFAKYAAGLVVGGAIAWAALHGIAYLMAG
jgi:hypothetical protein